ncbi:DLW-39 family protein [Intrasporangium calvum]|uniref:DLW-39 family protein n=1 Tax=Intrasporangium calvum TaxID=53358 RepID=A0ABT5GD44_9MICO|nr:DLW-39 family protein [Intrasporangium calvum]MDC5696148.1 DLW-39 family protein [Intrasporangium calvum]
MLKRLALIAGAAAGIVFVRKKARQQQAEQDLWNQATDDVRAQAPAPAPSPAADQDTTAATS